MRIDKVILWMGVSCLIFALYSAYLGSLLDSGPASFREVNAQYDGQEVADASGKIKWVHLHFSLSFQLFGLLGCLLIIVGAFLPSLARRSEKKRLNQIAEQAGDADAG